MVKKQKRKPYRIFGAYDSETTNIYRNVGASAFTILHQLGTIGVPIEEITAENVERETSLSMYRHTFEVCAALDEIAARELPFVPVICCHNLSFDMWPLADWLNHKNVRVLAKSRQKPVTFTIRDDLGNARLVLWDTLVFTAQSLETMGAACGYQKAVGSWDYDKIRTPETPLSAEEIKYAAHDIYALLAYLGYWCRKNPDIDPQKLGLNVVTKTGVVRERRRVRFDQLKAPGAKHNIGRYWMYLNREQAPKSDEELFIMHACTRGGFTFCASRNAGVPFDLRGTGRIVAGYDAASMHPAQMASHKYPVNFHETSPKALDNMFALVCETPLNEVLEHWADPFGVAFNALFQFEGLRLKPGTVFERDGVAPMASARITGTREALDEDNEQGQLFKSEIRELGYTDSATGAVFAFGKLVRAISARLYLTELAAWEMSRCYEWDSCRAIGGYCTMRFSRPSDMAIASVCNFFRAKNVFKGSMQEYEKTGTIGNADELQALGVPDSIALGMKCGTLSDGEVKEQYQRLKADLNSLFGIEASNEYRQDTELTRNGIDYTGGTGICNAPKNPKTFYQFGQRIVGWSRIAQICAIELAAPHALAIINGDTDSIKFLTNRADVPKISQALEMLGAAVDKGKRIAMARFRRNYPAQFDPLYGIGHYELEFQSECFCAAWNKAYCTYDVDPRDGKRHFAFTLAGVPARKGLNEFAGKMVEQGRTFSEVCSLILGFNVTIAHDMTGLNARSFPKWGSNFVERVTDCNGEESFVAEPQALALYPMDKTLNSLSSPENRANYEYVKCNNPNINADNVILTFDKNRNPVVINVEEF